MLENAFLGIFNDYFARLRGWNIYVFLQVPGIECQA